MNINQELLHSYNINSNWQYRRFLQQNANNIMQLNKFHAGNDNSPLYFNNDTPQSASDLKYSYLKKTNYKSNIISPEINPNNIL